MSLANHRRARNHIGGVHAAAMALLAESASGFLVGMNLPDHKLPLIKTLKIDYLKRRARGSLRAIATLAPEQRRAMLEQDKGEALIQVTLLDDSGAEPVRCEMHWAWVRQETPGRYRSPRVAPPGGN